MILLVHKTMADGRALEVASRISRKKDWRVVSICQGYIEDPETNQGDLWWFIYYEIPHSASTQEVEEVIDGKHFTPLRGDRYSLEPTPGPWRVGHGGSVVICDTDPTGGANTGHGGPSAVQYYGGNMIAESIWRRADAHLIAAVHDLRAACEATLKCWGPSQTWPRGGNQRNTLLLSENAITKAKRGESK